MVPYRISAQYLHKWLIFIFPWSQILWGTFSNFVAMVTAENVKRRTVEENSKGGGGEGRQDRVKLSWNEVQAAVPLILWFIAQQPLTLLLESVKLSYITFLFSKWLIRQSNSEFISSHTVMQNFLQWKYIPCSIIKFQNLSAIL